MVGLATALVACRSAPRTERDAPPPTPPANAGAAVSTAPEPAAPPTPVEEPALEEPTAALAEPGSHIPRPRVPRNLMFQATALAKTVAQARRGIVFTTLPGQGENGSNLVRGTAVNLELESFYEVLSCTRSVDAAHALSAERRVTGFGVYDISTVRIDHDGKVLWTAAAACEQLFEDDTACQGDILYEVPTVRSIAGPIASFMVQRVESRACGEPQSVLAVHTVDVLTEPEVREAVDGEDAIALAEGWLPMPSHITVEGLPDAVGDLRKEFIAAFWQYVMWLEIAYKILEKDQRAAERDSALAAAREDCGKRMASMTSR